MQESQLPQSVKKKRSFLGIQNCFVLILWAVSAVLFIGIGAGIYYIVDNRLNGEEVEVQKEEVEEFDEYEGWEIYENLKYGFSFKYPSDWEIEDTIECLPTQLLCGSLDVKKDNYAVRISVDPLYTGGGFGYLSELVVTNPEIVESEVSPAGYDAKMKTHYMDDTDVFEDETNEYNFGNDAWGWSVLFTEDVNGDYTIPGFGSGEIGDNIDGNFYGIMYIYEMQESDLSDLPNKGDEKLLEMFEIMDKITNSFDKTGTNLSDIYKGWTIYESDEYNFRFRYPSGWEIGSESGEPCVKTPEGTENFGFFITLSKDDWNYEITYAPYTYEEDATVVSLKEKSLEVGDKDLIRVVYAEDDDLESPIFKANVIEDDGYKSSYRESSFILYNNYEFKIEYIPLKEIKYDDSQDIINEMDEITQSLEII